MPTVSTKILLLLLLVICCLHHIEGKKMPSGTKWDGNSMSQTDMMEKDTVLVLDNEDNVIGSASKKDSHVFKNDQPRGVLHRAFSVFLFDESTGELLLQKRASTKITFPNVRCY
jgi:isopentenyl-diphosphate delta-isomerase